ncbi:hypothetical protein ACYF6T_07705 [Streptomyces sp. 7R007]
MLVLVLVLVQVQEPFPTQRRDDPLARLSAREREREALVLRAEGHSKPGLAEDTDDRRRVPAWRWRSCWSRVRRCPQARRAVSARQ